MYVPIADVKPEKSFSSLEKRVFTLPAKKAYIIVLVNSCDHPPVVLSFLCFNYCVVRERLHAELLKWNKMKKADVLLNVPMRMCVCNLTASSFSLSTELPTYLSTYLPISSGGVAATQLCRCFVSDS